MPSPQQPVQDKVIVISGASSGVGLETARQLAGQGGEIVMIARDQARGEHARAQVAAAAAGKPPVLLTADLSVQADVRRVAHEVKDRYGHVDILVNNAGAAFSRRSVAPMASIRRPGLATSAGPSRFTSSGCSRSARSQAGKSTALRTAGS